MKRAHLLVVAAIAFALAPAAAQERLEDRVPTAFVEDGKPISLEIIIYKPAGAGPFPTVMFNHGSTGNGADRSIVHAGTRPDHFNGVINFVGGWMSDDCPDPEEINTVSFRRGAGFQKPTLWLYGENDRFYSMGHSRKNFEAFIDAGGQGTFHGYSLGSGQNGHGLVFRPDLWEEELESFVEQMP